MKIWINKETKYIWTESTDFIQTFHLGMQMRRISGHSDWMIFEANPRWKELPSFDDSESEKIRAHLKED